MGIGYYLKNNQEPYVNPNTGKIDVRYPTPAGTDQWSAPTATPQQAAQISYAVSHTPAQVQQQQIAEEQARSASQPVPDARTAYALSQSPAKPAYIQRPGGDTGMPGLIGAVVIDRKPTPPSLPPDQTTTPDPAIMAAAPSKPLLSSAIAPHWVNGKLELEAPGTQYTKFMDTLLPQMGDTPGFSPEAVLKGLRDVAVYTPQGVGVAIQGGEWLARSLFTPVMPGVKNTQTAAVPGAMVGIAATGTAILLTSVKTHPAETITSIVAPALIAGAAGRGIAAIRTRGLTDIPIEQIGYDSPVGYPKNPTPTRLDLLKKSFDTNTLVPEPVEMSTGNPAPYTFTEKNPARLPTDVPGEKVVWTGWEKSPVNKVTEGTRFTLGKGSSELPGASAAPVAEAYFAKVGGQMPNVIGIDINPFKSPNIMHTVVEDVKIAPRGLQNEAAARAFFESQKPEPGTAYLFGIKAEYEANIPYGTELRFSAPRYRTTLGGIKIGERRILGTRVPIYEARTTGLRVMGETVAKPVELEVSTTSLKSKPILNVAYSGMPSYSISHPLSTSPFVRETSSPIYRESVVSEVSRIAPSSHVSSHYAPSETPRSSSSRRTSTTSVPPSSRPPSSSRPPGSYTPPYSKPPSYTPPRSTYRQPPYTPTYTPPRTGITGGSRLPIPMGASLRGSSSRGAGWGMWKGTTRTNRVVGLIQFFGRAMKKRKP